MNKRCLKGSKNIKVGHLNAQSVCNKSVAIRDLIIDQSIDILCLNETWLNENFTPIIQSLVPDTHKLFQNPRLQGRGGGVAVIAHNDLPNIKSINMNFISFECIHFSFNSGDINMNIFSIYRPPGPSREFINEFEEFLLESEISCENTFYVGDFNLWVDDELNTESKKFLNLLQTYNLDNYINLPTYQSGHTLDLVISQKHTNLLHDIEVELTNSISDHRLILFNIIGLQIDRKHKKMIEYRKINININEKFSQNISLLNYNPCMHNQSCCVHCLTQNFRFTAEGVYDKWAPTVQKEIRIEDTSKGWFCQDVQRAKTNLRKAEKKMKQNPTDETKLNYKRLRKIKEDTIQKSKENYFRSKIENSSSDPKTLYKELNYLLGKNNKNQDLPEHSSEKELANEFKNYFLAKVDKISQSFPNAAVPPSILIDFPIKSFDRFQPVSKELVLYHIKKMNKTYCPNDPIDIRKLDLTLIGEELSDVFSEIINKSFETGTFPESEKFSYVRPLIKAGKNPNDISSFRPLYNTSFLSKLLENVALQQLECHLTRLQYLPTFQSAYRKFHSVETAVCRIYNDLVINKAAGSCSILILLDLSAAFDTVDHSIFLNDLEVLGLSGLVLEWFKSYLTDRCFKVIIGKETSEIGKMKTGVPQGSVLGPILFTIYTAELSYLLKDLDVSFHSYADDTQIYFKVSDANLDLVKIKSVVEKVQNWMSRRKLKLNTDKTEIILIGSEYQLQNLNFPTFCNLNNDEIKIKDEVRNLGVIFDKNLSMKNHLKNIKSSVIGNIINISRISKYLDKPSMMKLVHGLVLSKIDFCNSIFYDLPDYDLRSLQLLINSAVRLVTGLPRFSRDHISPFLINLHILPIKARIEYKICLLTFKALHYGEPKYLAELLQKRENNSSLRSSSVRSLEEPIISRLTLSNRCFSYCAPRLYNSLPIEIQNADGLENFKKLLKTHLFRMAYDLENKCIKSPYKL